MREVAIVSAGMTPFGELWQHSLKDLFVEAALEALRRAEADTVDAVYVGNMSGGQFVGQEHLGPLLADHLGLRGVPITRVESACASGGVALRSAFLEVASGMSDLVLAAGVEKMNDGGDVTNVLATAADQEAEVYHGITFPGLYAMIARAHMATHGTTLEDLAAVSVKNHRHGALNPKAQFRQEVTLEQVMASSLVADPLRLLHCSPVSDGAAAVLLCPLERASEFTDRPVEIRASGRVAGQIESVEQLSGGGQHPAGQIGRPGPLHRQLIPGEAEHPGQVDHLDTLTGGEPLHHRFRRAGKIGIDRLHLGQRPLEGIVLHSLDKPTGALHKPSIRSEHLTRHQQW